MITPGYLPLGADRRTPFAATIRMKGVDLTGAALASQIRLYPDADGVPLVDLAQVYSAAAEGVRIIYAGSDTVANHITAGRLSSVPKGMAETDTLALSLIGMRVNETTMEGLPPAGRAGGDVTLAWDLHVTPSGGLKERPLYGPFLVRAGVTR